MRIVTVRRISQAFFLVLFVWFCLVTTLGIRWWQLRGWPVNWFSQLDPLVALGTVLTTQTLYRGLLWALFTVVLTILLGRFFCGWVCPFGTVHHFIGHLGKRRKPPRVKIGLNRYHRAQAIKYYILIFLLTAAAGTLIAHVLRIAPAGSLVSRAVLAAALAALAVLCSWKAVSGAGKATGLVLVLVAAWLAVGGMFPADEALITSLQTGLLDPIPLMQRSVNLVLLPLLPELSLSQRYYQGAWLIGAVFLGAVFINLLIPRFYCRFLCPLGALFGVLGRFALWRIGRTTAECSECELCDLDCEGACQPAGEIRFSECVLCMNCLESCKEDQVRYRTIPSEAGEITSPDLSRRGVLLSLISGAAVIPFVRLSALVGANWNPALIRPPGALAESEFLKRCLKCGQCMRVCPTNIIQPAGLEAGLEGLWTPVLNFRIGTSGCQLNCVACGQICPSAAIRPLSLAEKLGRQKYAEAGPIRLGTAFVDRGRCLPWAMEKPCIVCQETCPVSPKAVFTREHFATVRDGVFRVQGTHGLEVEVEGTPLEPGRFATGDYYCLPLDTSEENPRLIAGNTGSTITVSRPGSWRRPPESGSRIAIQVRLLQPHVDPGLCTGCGICEHECPVSGTRAIRVTAENESRHRRHGLLL